MNPEVLIEFERRDELAKAIIEEAEFSKLSSILENTQNQDLRHAFYNVEKLHQKEYLPNINRSIDVLGEAYSWQEFCAPNQKSYSQKLKQLKKQKQNQENLQKYFRFGGYFGSLAYRLQTNIFCDEQIDLPVPLGFGKTYGLMSLNYSNASTIFELLEKDSDNTTFYLIDILNQLQINYPNPHGLNKKATMLGAVASYHLCSYANWHYQGVNHELHDQMSGFASDAIWREF